LGIANAPRAHGHEHDPLTERPAGEERRAVAVLDRLHPTVLIVEKVRALRDFFDATGARIFGEKGPIRQKRRDVLGSVQDRALGSESRREILRTAEEIFARKGYSATSTREIAEAAGVTKGLLFYHFQTKERLYIAVIENAVKFLNDIVVPRQVEGLDRMAHVRSFVEGWTDFLTEHPHIHKLMTRELMDEGRFCKKLIDDYLKPLFQFGVSFVREGIEEGVFRECDPVHVVQVISASNVLYFTTLNFQQAVLGKNPLSPEVLTQRKEELWKSFSLMLKKD
jgi:TetR/AcrR family transcriptional regulator